MNLSRLVNTVKQHKFGAGLFFIAAFATWITVASLDGSDNIRLTPLTVTLTSNTSLPAEVKAQEAASVKHLIDRDTTTDFTAFASNTIKIQLDGAQSVDNLMVFGASAYRLSVRSFNQGIWQDVNEWTNIDLSKLSEGWQSLKTKSLLTAEALELSLVPDVAKGQGTVSAAIKEIAFWGKGIRTLITDVTSLDTTLKEDSVSIPAYVKSFTATPEQVVVNLQSASFNLELPYAPNHIEKVWLSYDAYGVNNWVSTRRQINGRTAVGGEYQFTQNQWKTLYEPLHPQWLIQGTNTIQFSVPNDVTGAYRIRNLRLLVLLDDGAHFEQMLTASPQSSLNDATLSHDGDTDTGWQPYLSATDKNAKPYLQIDFEKSMQLDHIRLYTLNNLNGSINLDVLVGDTWETGSNAIAGGQISSGWNTFAITSTSAAKALRLTFTDNGKSDLEIREIIPVASGVGTLYEPDIKVTYPQNGEYFGRSAYIRGYLNVEDNGSGKANLFMGGKAVTYDAGEFAALISKEDVQLSDQADDIAWQVTIDAVYPDGAKLTKVVYLNNYADSRETEGTLPHIIAKATPTNEQLIDYDEASLELTEGAVEKPVEIRITSLKYDDLPALDPGMTNVTRGPRRGYRFTPHGHKFKKKIKVTIPYDENLIPSGMAVTDIKTYYFDEETGHWIALEKVSIEKKKKRLISNTDHFTDMINATITVPDSPQAASFNPTQIKDIKAADPGAGINLIEPPQANNQGSANISYPIEIPAGRNGMQPQLAIQYNSGGGNGWLGLGWDLSVPSITIDTRWGVPRYDNGEEDDLEPGTPLETETYMLNGQQLSPVAHRGQLISRAENTTTYKGNTVKIFHTRVEGGFQKIIRHGTTPTDYWWEVIDKNGTRNFYGGDGESQDSDAILAKKSGTTPVFKWMLKKTVDTNNNTVTYKYKRVCDTGVKQQNGTYTCGGTGVAGYQLYIDKIFYTGHGTDQGAYSVEFTRDTQLNEARRPDVRIDARGGFKQVTSSRLRKIEVMFQETTLIRRYELTYDDTGPFKKSLLTLISQFDDSDNLFNEHKLEYYNEIKNGTGTTYTAFKTPVQWTTGDDNDGFQLIEGEAEYSALGATQGEATGGSASIGFGPFATKYLSANAMIGSNTSTSKGRLSLIDIDGDGLPDKVWGNDIFHYRKNTVTPNTPFDQVVNFEKVDDSDSIEGLTSLSDENTQSFNFGGQVYVWGINIIKDYAFSMTTTNKYLSDVNGDGLIDLVDSGTVKFNKKTASGDDVKFSALSEGSLYPIGAGAVQTEGLLPEEEFAEAEVIALEQNPLADAIRRWQAPFSGRVEISGNVQLVNVAQDPRYTAREKEDRENYKRADGVRVAIEKRGDTEPAWSQVILEDDFTVYGPGGNAGSTLSLDVVKGDVIYFRVHSRFEGTYDEVAWSPVVSYTQTLEDKNAGSQLTDVNGLNPYEYKAANEFIYGGRTTPVNLSFKGKIQITGALSKTAITTDDVKLSIYKVSAAEYTDVFQHRRDYHLLHRSRQPIYEFELKWNETGDLVLNSDSFPELDVKRDDKLFIIIGVDSAIDLSSVKWNAENPLSIYYTEAYEHDESPAPLDENGEPTDSLEDGWVPGDEITVKNSNDEYLIKPYPIYDVNFYPDNSLTTSQKDWAGPEMGWMLIEPQLTPEPKVIGRDPDALPVRVIDHNSEMVFTVKQKGKLLNKKVMALVGNSYYKPQQYSFAIPVPKGDKYFFDLSTRDPELAATLASTSVSTHYIRPKYTVNLSGVPLNSGASTKQWSSPLATVTVLPQISFKNNATPLTGTITLKVSHDVEDEDGDSTKVLVVNRQITLDSSKPFNPYEYAFNVVNHSSSRMYFSFHSDNAELVNQIQTASVKLAVGTNHTRNEKEFSSLTLFVKDNDAEEGSEIEDDTGKAVLPVTQSGILAVSPNILLDGRRDFNFDTELSIITKRRYTPLDKDGEPREDKDGNVIVIVEDVSQYNFSVTAGERYNPGKHTFDVPVVFDSRTEQDVSLILSYETTDTEQPDRNLSYQLWTQFRRHVFGSQVPSWTPPHMLHRQGLSNFFTSPYRGWTYGGYNANKEIINEETGEEKDYGQLMIDPVRFNLSNNTGDYSVPDSYEDRIDKADSTEMKSQTAFVVVPQAELSRWFIGDPDWRITSKHITSSRMGINYVYFMRNDDIDSKLPPTGENGGAGATGVPRLAVVSGADTTGVGFYVSISNSTTPVKGLLDYMDLNGDRFPDVVGSGKVQYTDMTGGLGTTTGTFGGSVRDSTSTSFTIAPGGTVPKATPNGQGKTNDSPPVSDKTSQNANYGFTGSLGYRDDTTDGAFRDVNGDGLPDRVTQNSNGEIFVELNIGYGFEKAEKWGVAPLSNSHSDFINAGISYNDGVKSYAGSISMTRTLADVEQTMTDVNGDGLPDRIRKSTNGLLVNMNTGTGFTDDIDFESAAAMAFKPGYNQSYSYNGGVSYNIPVGPLCLVLCFADINPGVNISRNMGRTEVMLQDINGDGYADYLTSTDESTINVSLNLARRTNLLKSVSRPLGGIIDISYKRTGNTFDLPQSRWVMDKVAVFDGAASDNPDLNNGSDYRAFKYDYQNGKHDRYEREFLGFANVVQEELNTKGVNLAADAANDAVFDTDIKGAINKAKVYRQSSQTYLNDSYYTKGLMIESQTKGRENVDKSGKLGELVLYRRSTSKYELENVTTGNSDVVIFPYLQKSEQFFYEGGAGIASEHKSSSIEYEYDDYGNVVLFTDYADSGSTADTVIAEIDYSADDPACLAKNITAKPTQIIVKGSSTENTLRKRNAVYNCDTGNLEKVHQYSDESTASVTKLEYYTKYGNLKSVTGPVNHNKQTLTLSFIYDDIIETYPVKITNESYNIFSEASYDYKFGKPLCTLDVNGNPLKYKYDSFGRTTQITGPKELGEGANCDTAANDSVFTIKFDYKPYVKLDYPRKLSMAKTEHYNRDARGQATKGTINTWLFTDGIKRVLQTKKTAEVVQGSEDGAEESPRQIVSGRVSFDALGRSVKQYYPTFETGSADVFNPEIKNPQVTEMVYDALDRNTLTILPDATETEIEYGFGTFTASELNVGINNYFKTTVTDANIKHKTTYRDTRELIYAVEEEEDLTTTYKYDKLKQITDVLDAAGNNTHVEYDDLGRRTSINNLDTGLTRYKYDLASNLIEKITANRNGKVGILYNYDFTRLQNITYPTYEDNNVSYRYGDQNHKTFNQAGRITEVTHQGGTDTREYGKLGEVTLEKRVLYVAARGTGDSAPVATYITEYDFDTFGRLMTLTLPDTEVITHTYNAAGNLYNIRGSLHGNEYAYLKSMTYDEFEQRRSLELGNGVKTRYHYDPAHRRLCRLESGLTLDQAASNAQDCETLSRQVNSDEEQDALIEEMVGIAAAPKGQFQNINYAYDLVGNILGTANAVAIPRPSDMGGPAIQTFRYDDLYRLTKAKGQFTNTERSQHRYTLTMQYSDIHNILQKTQEHTLVRNGGTPRIQRATTYDWGYQYKTNGHTQPHAPTHIGNRTFSYDDNGNQLGWENDDNGTKRNIEWDDENRIQKIGDPKNTLVFAYDDSGTRVLKRGKEGQTAYVNQFFTVKNQALASKHIFAGTSRIATKVEPGAPVGTDPSNSGLTDSTTTTFTTQTTISNANVNANENASKPKKQSFIERVTSFFTDGTHPGQGVDKRNDRANEVAQNTLKNPNLNGGTLPTGNNKGGNGNNANTGNEPNLGNSVDHSNSGSSNANEKSALATGGTFLYYYHPDHLGSTGYVTDEDAELYEHVEYFPFGETWISEAANSEQRVPYRYTSKEFDEETGLYYYGARYYDPRTSVWQSVDPILDSYLLGKQGKGGVYKPLNLGMYSYSHQNPINYVDPDGNSVFSVADWVDFGSDVGGLIVDEIVYVVAVVNGNDAVAELAVQGMVSKRADAAISTVGIISPVPRTGQAIRGAKALSKTKVGKTLPCSFAPGTLVMTKEGLKPIETLTAGDFVLARDDKSGEQTWQKVLQHYNSLHDDAIRLTYTNNETREVETVITTAEHPFYVINQGWTRADQLTAGAQISTAKGGFVKVGSSTWLQTEQLSYNMTIDQYHTYFVGNQQVWVHNACDIGGKVHGNSKASTKAQHRYEIYKNGKLYKTGISGGKLNKRDSSSRRANSQVNKFNNNDNGDVFTSKVVDKNIPGRREALNREQNAVNDFARSNPQGKGPEGNIRPQPKLE